MSAAILSSDLNLYVRVKSIGEPPDKDLREKLEQAVH